MAEEKAARGTMATHGGSTVANRTNTATYGYMRWERASRGVTPAAHHEEEAGVGVKGLHRRGQTARQSGAVQARVE